MQYYVDFIVAKQVCPGGYSCGPAYEALAVYFDKDLEPALKRLLDATVASGDGGANSRSYDLLLPVAHLCEAGSNEDPASAPMPVALLVDGLHDRVVRTD